MIRQKRFGWRIAAIVTIGFMATLSVPIAIYFMFQGLDKVAGLPQPARLAAMAQLFEQNPDDNREQIYAAFHSTQLSLRVLASAEVRAELSPLWPGDDARIARYRAALEDRDFAAYEVPRKLFQRSFRSLLTAAEFRIALRGGGVLIVTSESAAWFTSSGLPIGFPFAISGVVIALIALILLNREFRPVLRLARAVEALDLSDPNARLPSIKSGTGEVQTLVETFRQQQQRVTELLQARATMIGGIQHDVRTFATRLRLRTENLPDPDDRARAEAEIADLVSLMDSALLATRQEAGKLDLELLNLAHLLDSEIQDQRAAGAAVTITVEPEAAEAQVLGDRLALRRVFANLIENALRHGETAHVHIGMDCDNIVTAIDDDGPGIPRNQRTNLLEPFARLEPSRSRQTGGAGLGLAIVRTLVENHEGRLEISDGALGGARLTVQMPRFSSSDGT